MTPSSSPTELDFNTLQIKSLLLKTILWFVLAANTFAILFLLPQVKGQAIFFLLPILLTSAISLALFPVVRRGYVTLASIILLSSLWIILILYVLISGGLRSPTYPIFLVFIFATGLLLGEKAGLWAIGLNLLASLGIYLSDRFSLIQQLIPPSETSYWINSIFTFLIIGGLYSLNARWAVKIFEQAKQEIIARKKVENELRRNQSLLTLAQQIGKIGHFSIEVESGAVHWSDQLYRLFNLDAGEVQLTPELFDQHIHPGDQLAMTELQQEALNGSRTERELRMLTKEGEIRYVHVVANLMSPNSPTKIILGTVQDITGRKLAEQAHKLSEERYQTFLKQATEGVWRLEFDQPISTELKPFEQVHLIQTTGYIAECNDALAHMYGYTSHSELEGKRLLTLYGGITSEQNTNATLKLVEDGYRSGNRETIEYNAQGEPVYFLNSALGIIKEGRLIAIWGTQQDISDLKKIQNALRESEEVFRGVIEQSNDGIVLIDEQGVIIQWNQSMEILTEISASEAIGYLYQDTMLRLLPIGQKNDQNIISKFQVNLENLSTEKRQNWNVRILEQTITHSDGSIRYLQQSLSPIKIQNGYLFCWITRDITGQKQFAEEIQRLNLELEQRVQDRTTQLETALDDLADFSYSIAHDLRAPLRGIDGYSKFIAEDYGSVLDKQGIEYIESVRHGAQHMGQLLDDMLILLRVIRADLNPVEINLSHLVENIFESYQRQDPDHLVNIQIEPSLTTYGDYGLIITLLDNLVNNAWKFSRYTTHATIEFGLNVLDDSRVFYIRDNGVGFDSVNAKRLFTAFHRFHTEGEFEGTGIGLAICQRIVERHNGMIWAESEVGKGSTLYFTLRTQPEPKSINN